MLAVTACPNGIAHTYMAAEALTRPGSRGRANDSFGHSLYKHLMNGVSHMLPFVVGGGIMIALAFLLDDYTIDPSNFGMNTPVAAFFKTVGSAAFGYMLPILAALSPCLLRTVRVWPSALRRRAGHERYELCRPCPR